MLDLWETFLSALDTAVRGVVAAHFAVERHDAPRVERERAYCYELYYQLRQALGNNFPYTLHGEVDKHGHDFITQLAGGKAPNPDFILHRPGTMDNFAVIEVKRSDCGPREAAHDLRKLCVFVRKAKYQHGLWLAFGSARPPAPKPPCEGVLMCWHSEAGERLIRLAPAHVKDRRRK